jgi:PTH1 family peptidyl-tRNA hydrolase
MRLVVGLGNPGAEYARTRHNVAWWLLEHARANWQFPEFVKEGATRVTGGRIDSHQVVLLEPLTYVNLSGAALEPWLEEASFDPRRDLLVVVDDVALDPGRVRIRAGGSSGGHNGLRSVEETLGSREYARLRIGVGAPPSELDLADWVLSPMPREDEERVLDLMPDLTAALETWVREGAEAAARAHNR